MVSVLVDPRRTMERAIANPMPVPVGTMLWLAAIALGAATLPRQLPLLATAFPLTGDVAADFAARAMRSGLSRLIVADRLVPSPTLLIAAVLTAVAADPVLVLARERRAALWSMILLGLAPLVLLRVGELALTWLASLPAGAPPGEIIALPHKFRTGPALLWRQDGTPPVWLERLDATVNAVSLWSLALWSIGLARLDGRPRLAPWHIGLPAVCLAGGAIVTWVLAPTVLAAVLGTP